MPSRFGMKFDSTWMLDLRYSHIIYSFLTPWELAGPFAKSG